MSVASSRRQAALRYGESPTPEHHGSRTSGWRLHIHDLTTESLPVVRSGEEKKAWSSLYMKLTAMWSGVIPWLLANER